MLVEGKKPDPVSLVGIVLQAATGCLLDNFGLVPYQGEIRENGTPEGTVSWFHKVVKIDDRWSMDRHGRKHRNKLDKSKWCILPQAIHEVDKRGYAKPLSCLKIPCQTRTSHHEGTTTLVSRYRCAISHAT